MHVWYIQPYANPPGMGRIERPVHIAKAMARRGHRLTLVTSAHHHLRFERVLPYPTDEPVEVGDVETVFVPTPSYADNGLFRAINMVSFGWGVGTMCARARSGRGDAPDLIIASSPHMAHLPALVAHKQVTGTPLLFEVRDLWPESLVETAGVSPLHPVILWMRAIERTAYRHADGVVSLIPRGEAYLAAKGFETPRYRYVPNGVDGSRWASERAPLPRLHEEVFSRLEATGKLIMVYTGAHGPPNALDRILDLARLPGNDDPPYHVVFIGQGASREALVDRARREGISFVDFLPQVSSAQARAAMERAHVGFVGARPGTIYRYGISPNKLFEYFMAGLPVVLMADVEESQVARARAGEVVPAGDVEALGDALARLAAMSTEERAAMGARGRAYVLEQHEWGALGDGLVDLSEAVVTEKRAHTHPPI